MQKPVSFSKGKLGLLSTLILFGAAKSHAQETIPPTPIEKVKPISPVDLLKPAPMTIKFPGMKKIPLEVRKKDSVNLSINFAQIAKIISTADNDSVVFLHEIRKIFPFVYVQDINISEDPSYLYKPQGAYLPRKDSVRMYNCYVPAGTISTKVYDEMFSAERMERELKKRRDNTPFVTIHEIKHWLDRHAYSRLGMLMHQIIQINLHEEITARITELRLRRENKPNEIKKQMDEVYFIASTRRISRDEVLRHIRLRGLQGGDSSEAKDIRSRIGDYGEYLYNDSLVMSDSLAQAEIDAIVRSAIIMMTEHLKQYDTEIPKLLISDMQPLAGSAGYFTPAGRKRFKAPAIGFDAAIRSTYDIGDVNFLTECSPAVQQELLLFVKKATDAIAKKKNVIQLFADWGHLDDISRDFASQIGFSTDSEFDTKNIIEQKRNGKAQERTR